jgi:hypothetical protein
MATDFEACVSPLLNDARFLARHLQFILDRVCAPDEPSSQFRFRLARAHLLGVIDELDAMVADASSTPPDPRAPFAADSRLTCKAVNG